MSDQQSTPEAQPLPDQYEAAAHMYPCDLETFKTGEHVISAFSIPVGSPDHGKSVPLWTSEQMDDHARKAVRAFIDQAPEATGEPVTVEALHDESGTVYLPVLRLGGVRLYGKERPRLRWAQAVADSVNAEFAPPQRPQGQEGGV